MRVQIVTNKNSNKKISIKKIKKLGKYKSPKKQNILSGQGLITNCVD